MRCDGVWRGDGGVRGAQVGLGCAWSGRITVMRGGVLVRGEGGY